MVSSFLMEKFFIVSQLSSITSPTLGETYSCHFKSLLFDPSFGFRFSVDKTDLYKRFFTLVDETTCLLALTGLKPKRDNRTRSALSPV